MAAIVMSQEEVRSMRKKGTKLPKSSLMAAEEVRRWAIRVLHELVDLEQAERERVLRHAITVNRAVLRVRKPGNAPEESLNEA